MPRFRYEAQNFDGKRIQGVFEGNYDEVVAMIREKNFFPTEISEIKGAKDIKELHLFGKVDKKSIAMFCHQFASVIKAGVPMTQSLYILYRQTENKMLKAALETVYEDVQTGRTLSESMADHPKVFPPLLINMVNAGEVSGTLEESLERMAVHFEKDYKLQRKVKGAMIYPVTVLIVAVLVVVFLLLKVVPTFEGIFGRMGTDLPAPTKMLLSASGYVQQNGLYLLIGAVLVLIAARMYIKTHNGRFAWHSLLMKLPVVKKLLEHTIAARFSRTLGTLTSTGVPLEEALGVTGRVVNNAPAEKAIQRIQEDVNKGDSIALSMERTGLFPVMLVQMTQVGEESGTLDSMLNKTADYYEGEVEANVSRLTSLMEPLIIVVLGGIVAFIVLSIALPMFDMVNLAGG
jgi:type IV pilus assembly protein PilC